MQRCDKTKPKISEEVIDKALQKKGMRWFLLCFGDHPHKAFELNLSLMADQERLRSYIRLVNDPEGEEPAPGWHLCEFKNEEAYRKGRRLVGQHCQLRKTWVWEEAESHVSDWSDSIIEFYRPIGMTVEDAKERWLSFQEAKKPKGKWERHEGIPIGTFQRLVQPLGYTNLPLKKSEKKAIREEHQFRGYSVAKLAEDWDVSESLIRKLLKDHKPPVSPSGETINKGVSDTEPPVPGREVLQHHGFGQ